MTRVALISIFVTASAWAQSGNARAAELAKTNARAKRATDFIAAKAKTLKDPAIKKVVLDLLASPQPSFLALYETPEAREALRKKLVAAEALDDKTTMEQLFPPVPAAPFGVAPGSPVGKHHDWPGGLAEHTAFNLKSSLALEAAYRADLGVDTLDHDLVVAAPILHDILKAWVVQWQADGTTLLQPKLAGTASHHTLITAELLYRKAPAALALAVANAHEPAGAPVVLYLRAAALIAGIDPVAAGVLTDKGELPWPVLPEGAINHLGDHDWILEDPAEGVVRPAIEKLAREAGAKDDAEVHWRAHAVETKASGLQLYSAWVKGGDPGLAGALKKQGVSP